MFFNSVFKSVNLQNNSITYDNEGDLDVKVFNSVLHIESNFVNSYTVTSTLMAMVLKPIQVCIEVKL